MQTTLKTVSIPASVRYIGNYVFESCFNLRTVTIENGVSYLSRGIFSNCDSLNKIIFTGTKAQWAALEKDSDWLNGRIKVVCTDGEENLSGCLTGEAALTNYFNGTKATVSAAYEKQSFAAGEEQSFILEIPLDALQERSPLSQTGSLHKRQALLCSDQF